MRASDREREATIRVLRDGRAEGRLSTVSRRHAQLVRRDDAYVLTDLGSTNGTWIGGRRVVEVEVAPGDLLRLGDLPLRLR